MYYFHGHNDDLGSMSPVVKLSKNGSYILLKDTPFEKEYAEDPVQFESIRLHPALYYRRFYKELKEEA